MNVLSTPMFALDTPLRTLAPPAPPSTSPPVPYASQEAAWNDGVLRWVAAAIVVAAAVYVWRAQR